MPDPYTLMDPAVRTKVEDLLPDVKPLGDNVIAARVRATALSPRMVRRLLDAETETARLRAERMAADVT